MVILKRPPLARRRTHAVTGHASCASALFAVLVALPAAGADIRSVEIERIGNRYTLVSDTHFDASRDDVFDVLTDYDHLSEISETIEESHYVAPDDNGQPLVYSRISACVLFFCKSVNKIEQLETSRPGFIRTTAIPERSNIRYSRSEWDLRADDDGGTKVIYRVEFEPAFWVPPLIGAALIKRTLMIDGASAVDHIEALAQRRAAADGR